MYQSVLADLRLYEVLLRLDQDLARAAQAGGCRRCGGRLDRADYARKPRGVPPELGAEHAVRRSFCCSAEGCRRRTTPSSARFLGRRVYVGAAILGITALRPGARRAEARALRVWLGVSARTLARWRRWWRVVFAASVFWRRARGQLRTPVPRHALPGGLLRRFAGDLQAQSDRGVALPRPDHHRGGRYMRDGGRADRTRRRCALHRARPPPRVRSDLASEIANERSAVDERVSQATGP